MDDTVLIENYVASVFRDVDGRKRICWVSGKVAALDVFSLQLYMKSKL